MTWRAVLTICLLCLPAASCRKNADAPPPAPSSKPAPPAGTTERPRPATAPVARVPASAPIAQTRPALAEPATEAAALAKARQEEARRQADSPRALIVAGDRALAAGQPRQAVGYFSRAVERDQQNLDALKGLSVALVADEHPAEAIPVYEMMLGLAPKDPTVRFNYAAVLARVKKFDAAEDVYRKLLADHEDFVQARYNLAVLYQVRGKLDLARLAWQEVIQQRPDLPYPHAKFGELLMDLGRPQEAMEQFAQAAKLGGDDAATWQNLSVAAQACGSLGRAVVAAKKAAALAPNDPRIYLRLGGLHLELYRQTGKTDLLREALTHWRKSLVLNADQPAVKKLLDQYEPILAQSTSAPAK